MRDSALKPEEGWMDLHDFETGARLQAGRGSVFWNEHRGRWIMLVTAKPGEIWFAEADTIVGPWVYARRVVSHDNYNFYNPTQHPFFDQQGGKLIYFEGTYTASFSGAKEKTPRYDYNQIMYRLALDDPRLALPAPVYRVRKADGKTGYLMRGGVEAQQAWESVEAVEFFAVSPTRVRTGLVPIVAALQNGRTVLQMGPSARSSENLAALCFALPAHSVDSKGTASDNKDDAAPKEDRSSAVVALYEYQREDGERVYSTRSDLPDRDLKRLSAPLCRVWKNPMTTLALDPRAHKE
jgi:hypothetical protein